MITLLLQTVRLFRTLGAIVGSPEGRGVSILIAVQLAGGTVFYHQVEGWRWLDALYFCVITLTTIGYGDLAPATDLGKVFTMMYVVSGIGLFVSFATLVGRHLLDQRQQRTGAETE